VNLCVSNIAWNVDEDSAAMNLLQEMGVDGIELAPTRWWPDLSRVSLQQVAEVRSVFNGCGVKPLAFQSVLFGQPQLSIFDPSTRKACRDYLLHVIELACRLAVPIIVFGSPRNRRRGTLSIEMALASATEFFGDLSQNARKSGVRICFEPNPSSYGGDFGCTVQESMALIEAVDSDGFQLNLDLGGISMNGETPSQVVHRACDRIGHVHLSEPNLSGFLKPVGPHHEAGDALVNVGYSGAISLEFRRQSSGLAAVVEAVAFARSVYRC